MAKSLNLDALRSATVYHDPWHFAHHENAVYDPEELSRTRPATGFELYLQKGFVIENGNRFRKEWNGKEEQRALIELGAGGPHDPDNLRQPWLDLVDDLLSDDYRAAIGELAHIDMRSLKVRAYYHIQGGEYGKYDCQSHVDYEYERITHVYFLDAPEGSGSYWMTPTGDPKERHLGVEIPPKPNQTIIQVRSDNAWHGITAHNVPRQMIHIVWEEEK